jgi:hypothetical protein
MSNRKNSQVYLALITMLNKKLQCEMFTFSVILRIFGFILCDFHFVFDLENLENGNIAEECRQYT